MSKLDDARRRAEERLAESRREVEERLAAVKATVESDLGVVPNRGYMALAILAGAAGFVLGLKALKSRRGSRKIAAASPDDRPARSARTARFTRPPRK